MESVVLSNIEKDYDGTMACSDINLDINEGEFFTFLGPSGCGKTTILRLIAGFIQPRKGSIYLGGRDITNLPAEKRNIGMVFQNYALFPFMTVYENIEYGLKIQKMNRNQRAQKVEQYLELVDLIGFEKRRISELSGGEQQRVALARSLAIEPGVLLLDEPLSNLDARLRDRMRGELKTLQRSLGITTIFVTHDQTEALTMSDRLAVFAQGRCIQVGTPGEIYSSPASTFAAGFIGETNLIRADIRQGKACISAALTLTTEGLETGKYISIRPQDIAISVTDNGNINSFPATVTAVQFNGISTDYEVELAGTLFRVTVLNNALHRSAFSIGDKVFLAFAEDGIRVLEQ